jgi:hypothetical protein
VALLALDVQPLSSKPRQVRFGSGPFWGLNAVERRKQESWLKKVAA